MLSSVKNYELAKNKTLKQPYFVVGPLEVWNYDMRDQTRGLVDREDIDSQWSTFNTKVEWIYLKFPDTLIYSNDYF